MPSGLLQVPSEIPWCAICLLMRLIKNHDRSPLYLQLPKKPRSQEILPLMNADVQSDVSHSLQNFQFLHINLQYLHQNHCLDNVLLLKFTKKYKMYYNPLNVFAQFLPLVLNMMGDKISRIVNCKKYSKI